MRLIIDGHRLTRQRTGVGRVLEMLLDEWAETGWPLAETLLITQEDLPAGRWPGLKVISAGARLPGLIWRSSVLASNVKRGDLLFCPTNLLPRTQAARTVLFIFDTLLEAVPETFPWHIRMRFRSRYRGSARRSDVVVVPSRSTREDVLKYYGVDPSIVRVVPLAPDPIFETRPGQRPHPNDLSPNRGRETPIPGPYFLAVGKRSRRRNGQALIEAFAAHRRAHPDHRLVLAGPGTEEGFPDWIIPLGHVSDAELSELYRGALATLYLSDYEGFGLPILEAQASGCPVVTLRNSALVETAGDGAILLDGASLDSLVEALSQISSDAAVRESLVHRGLSNAARFSRSRMGREVRSILRQQAPTSPA